MENSPILPRKFYDQEAEIVARELLGKRLVCGRRAWEITETEAYLGPFDLVAHSRFGPTKRNKVLFGPAGRTYVYLVYGMYHCLNVTTGPEGSAVLIRAAGGIVGPGRLCRSLGITRKLNGIDVTVPGSLYITAGQIISPARIIATPRIGIEYAHQWRDKKLRFCYH